MRCARFVLLLLSSCCVADERWGFYVAQSYRFGDDVNTDVPFEVSDDAGRATSIQLWAPHAATTNWQLYFSRFQNSIDGVSDDHFRVRHAQFGGIKATASGNFTPFVGATIGAAQIDTAIETQTRWAYTLSAGLRWQMLSHVSLIADARWLGILFNSATTIACDDNQCKLHFDSGAWSQYELGLAVGVQF